MNKIFNRLRIFNLKRHLTQNLFHFIIVIIKVIFYLKQTQFFL
jgi:hypothetical protein